MGVWTVGFNVESISQGELTEKRETVPVEYSQVHQDRLWFNALSRMEQAMEESVVEPARCVRESLTETRRGVSVGLAVESQWD